MKTRSSLLFLLTVLVALTGVACGDDPEDENSTNISQNQDGDAEPDPDGDAESDPPETIEDLDPATFSTDAEARRWATYSAPSALFTALVTPQFDAVGEELEENPDCPTFVEDADSITITGGCTAADGRTWEGTYTGTSDGNSYAFEFGEGSISTEYTEFVADGFTVTSTETCEADESIEHEIFTTYEGTVTIDSIDEENATFSVDMTTSGTMISGAECELVHRTFFVEYEGEFEILETDEEGTATRHLWNGSGEAGEFMVGRADVETVDELIDDTLCEHEPYSGVTRLTAEGSELEFRYNGESDCDEDATISWYVDDEEQGQIDDIRCSTTSTTPTMIGLLLISIFLLRLRRPLPITPG